MSEWNTEIRCFNRGDWIHVRDDCPTKHKEAECFGCKSYGYSASKYRNKTKEVQQIIIANRRSDFKTLRGKYKNNEVIEDKQLKSLIDSGSHLYFMRASCYVRINFSVLQEKTI